MNLAVDCDYFNYFVPFVTPELKEKIDNENEYILIPTTKYNTYCK